MKHYLRKISEDPVRLGAVLFVVALVVRVVYVAQGYPVPPQDTRDYDDIAMNLLQGNGFVATQNWFGYEVRSWRAPFYPAFLSAVYAVAGYSHEAVRWVQCFVGALTVVVVYGIGRRLDAKSACIAGGLACVYGPLVAVSHEVMTETWFTFWTVFSIWGLIENERGQRSDSSGRRWLVLAGVSVGMAALTRPVGLLVLPAYALYQLGRDRRAILVRAGMVGGVALLVTLPWMIRNYDVHGEWAIFSTHGGFILLRSNWETPDWRRPDGWQISKAAFDQIPSEVERDRVWFRQGVSVIVGNPLMYMRWSAERFVRTWYFFRPSYNFWFALILPFFFAGLVRYGRLDGFRLPAALIITSVLVFTFILYGSTRFRLPLEPFFILFAVSWCANYVRRAGVRSAGMVIAGYGALNLLVLMNAQALRASLLQLLESSGLK